MEAANFCMVLLRERKRKCWIPCTVESHRIMEKNCHTMEIFFTHSLWVVIEWVKVGAFFDLDRIIIAGE